MTYITAATKIAALRREIHMRQRVYPSRIAAGKMTQAEADREIAVMLAILADYMGPDLFGAPAAA